MFGAHTIRVYVQAATACAWARDRTVHAADLVTDALHRAKSLPRGHRTDTGALQKSHCVRCWHPTAAGAYERDFWSRLHELEGRLSASDSALSDQDSDDDDEDDDDNEDNDSDSERSVVYDSDDDADRPVYAVCARCRELFAESDNGATACRYYVRSRARVGRHVPFFLAAAAAAATTTTTQNTNDNTA
mmetsp:Transcript_27035/g.108213  ORF Transcript_27035/g.108213 Transcript_27035/m.108213 type:complete len:189 (-) Transcript_27035:185-751(-)